MSYESDENPNNDDIKYVDNTINYYPLTPPFEYYEDYFD